ncbi:MAG: BON domain-containing protein [Isosphaeraceae bacterium]
MILRTSEHSDEEKGSPRATASLHNESLEDCRLAERVECALRATGYGALGTVQVSVKARVVMLGGRVATYYLKQVAQEAALAVPGAHQIRNGLDVVHPN